MVSSPGLDGDCWFSSPSTWMCISPVPYLVANHGYWVTYIVDPACPQHMAACAACAMGSEQLRSSPVVTEYHCFWPPVPSDRGAWSALINSAFDILGPVAYMAATCCQHTQSRVLQQNPAVAQPFQILRSPVASHAQLRSGHVAHHHV